MSVKKPGQIILPLPPQAEPTLDDESDWAAEDARLKLSNSGTPNTLPAPDGAYLIPDYRGGSWYCVECNQPLGAHRDDCRTGLGAA